MTCRGSAGAPRVAQNRACPYKLEDKAASRRCSCSCSSGSGGETTSLKKDPFDEAGAPLWASRWG
jgi:hypothetical protein